ncbi:MAG TPA: hypothetical protein VHO69_05080 [Phototrophicaceae bacterium]|nr:hypothetical protein [Phototrophicaceae bacterium]
MNRKLFLIVLVVLSFGLFAAAVAAQDAPSISVSDQVSTGSVVIDRVVSDGPGFVVVRSAGGRGTPGPVLGHTAVEAGVNENVRVDLNLDLAASQLFAALHTDDGEVGLWEFGVVANADGPVKVDDVLVQQLFTAQVIEISDQPVAENTVTADTVVTNGPGWLVIQAGDSAAAGEVLGQAPVHAGRNADVTVELAAAGQTDVLWATLYTDAGTAGEFEDADTQIEANGEAVSFPIWTTPHIRLSEQAVTTDDAGNSVIVVDSALSAGPGFVVIHADDNGAPGAVLGFAPLADGANPDVSVTLDQGTVTPVVWAMLHTDAGTEGEFEADADVPVTDANGDPIALSVNLSGVDGAVADVEATPEAVTSDTTNTTGNCTVAAANAQGTNVRRAPSTAAEVVLSLTGDMSREPVGQFTSADGFVWFQLSEGSWVRSDAVTSTGACATLPLVSADVVPEATPGA